MSELDWMPMAFIKSVIPKKWPKKLIYIFRMKNINVEVGKIQDFLTKNNFTKTVEALTDECSEKQLKPFLLNNEKLGELKNCYQEGDSAK